MHEGGGVIPKQRKVGHLLPPHHGAGEILGQLVLVFESSLGGVNVDHRHGFYSLYLRWSSSRTFCLRAAHQALNRTVSIVLHIPPVLDRPVGNMKTWL